MGAPMPQPIKRLLGLLTDLRGRDRTVLLLLAVYALAWTIYGVIAKGSQDIHADMSELVAWARSPALGYLKHPPLAAWLVAAWFEIFPLADWSYYLLAMVTATAGLWVAWRISADYLEAEKRVTALALLTLIPFFNFQALKFNVNTVLIPLWALTTLCFLRSQETRSPLWAALAGASAAAAMLGKYWSIFLLIGLGVAAILDSERARYFRSAAPWITVAVGALLIAPHVIWLVANDFLPFSYALAVHQSASSKEVAAGIFKYLAGGAGYVALPTLLAFACTGFSRAAVVDALLPGSAQRRRVAFAFWGPLLAPVVLAPIGGIEIDPLWTMSSWTLLGIVLLSSPLAVIRPQPMFGVVTLACAFPFGAVAVAPVVAMAIQGGGVSPLAAHASLLVQPVERAWQETTDKPLRIVGGEMAMGLAFYLPGGVEAVPVFLRSGPWIDDAGLARDGIAIVCRVEDAGCRTIADGFAARAAGSRMTQTTVARRYAGIEGPAQSYIIVTVPPAS